MSVLLPHLPTDRRVALAQQRPLPHSPQGVALIADIAGFTTITETFVQKLGRREGAEALLHYVNPVYQLLIDQLHRYQGSVISFAGDALICWLDDTQGNAVPRAITCGLAIQAAMRDFVAPPHALPADTVPRLRIKIAMAAGPAKRFLFGDPDIHVIEAVIGETLERMSLGETITQPGEVLVSQEMVDETTAVATWREVKGQRFAVIANASPAQQAPPVNQAEIISPDFSFPAEQLRPWLLPLVYQNTQRGGQYIGDLRLVTTLMLRFRSSGFAIEDTVGEQLDKFIRWVQAVVHQYGGNLLQLIAGDKGTYLYATFGAPIAYEDNVYRALLTALTLQEEQATKDFPTGLQIGISQGDTWTGVYGAPQRHTYGVIGRAVNLAARLMMKAQAGQIIVSEQAYDPTKFIFEPLGEVSYKGFERPVATYQLLGKRQQEASTFTPAIIGRQTELQQMRQFLMPLATGQFAGGLCIYGEPGMGKSHLVRTLQTEYQAQHRHIQWLIGQTDQVLQQPLNPFVYFLRSFFDHERLDRSRFMAQLDHICQALPDQEAALKAELQRTHSFLGALLGLYWEQSLYQQLDSAQLRYQNTLQAVQAFLRALACLQPVIIVLEDVHWLDSASRELLGQLLSSATGYPLAFLLTARYNDDGSHLEWLTAVEFSCATIDLNTLSPDDLAQLAQVTLGGAISPALYDLLYEKSQANPFFAQQLLLYFRKSNLLLADEQGQWSIQTENPVWHEVPTNINAILIARLDRLQQRVKEVVQTAAVLGREFKLSLLENIVHEEVTSEVIQAEREQVWLLLQEINYIFKHALLREAAYAMQLQTRRRELHRLAAEALLSLYPDTVAEHYEEVAYHYEAAYQQGLQVVRELAGDYLSKAGQVAADKYEIATAVDYYTRSLNLTPPHDKERRYTRLLARQALYDRQGNRDLQRQDLQALTHLAEGNEEWEATIALCQAEIANATGDYTAAIEHGQQAIDLSQANPTLRIKGLLEQGRALRLQSQYDAADISLQQALRAAQEKGLPEQEAAILLSLGSLVGYQGQLAQAQAYFQAGQVILHEIGNLHSEGVALLNLGGLATLMGDWIAARTYFEQSLRIMQTTGDQRGIGIVLSNLGVVHMQVGDYQQAYTYFTQGLAIRQAIGDRRGEGMALLNLGSVAYCQGDFVTAQQYFQRDLALRRTIGDKAGEGYDLMGLGMTLTSMGQLAEGEMTLQQAADLRQQLGNTVLAIETYAALAEVYWRQGKLDAAQAALVEVLAYLDDNPELDGAEYGFRTYLIGYQILATAGDPRAATYRQIACDLIQQRAEKILNPDTRHLFLTNIPWHPLLLAQVD